MNNQYIQYPATMIIETSGGVFQHFGALVGKTKLRRFKRLPFSLQFK